MKSVYTIQQEVKNLGKSEFVPSMICFSSETPNLFYHPYDSLSKDKGYSNPKD